MATDKPAKQFIAVSSVVCNGRLIGFVTSTGENVINEDGLTSAAGIAFLHSLVHKRKRKSNIRFICYGANRDNELLFSDQSSGVRDRLFQSIHVQSKIHEIETSNESAYEILYSESDKESLAYQQADFDLYVNGAALQELKEVKIDGFTISLANGKCLTIRKGGKAVSLFDVQGFFKGLTFQQAIEKYTGIDFAAALEVGGKSALFTESYTSAAERLAFAFMRALLIAQLMDKVDAGLVDNDINLTKYIGAGSIATHWLGKMKARDNFYSYTFRPSLAPEFWKAQRQSYYGGRSEQFKIGTLENVKVYDINSAYANAVRFLPAIHRKPVLRKEWQAVPFSVWFVEYDLRNTGSYFGLMPNRAIGNTTQYKLCGSGYFWQPEVLHLIRNFPQHINIKRGYVYDCQELPFDDEIQRIYDLRERLRKGRDPLERVIKLALASIYGKFCQSRSKGRYYNLAYAGFVTSFVRAQLLDAVQGRESATITFQTDAIHSTELLNVEVSDAIGAYKLTEYDYVTYIDNGIYKCMDAYGETLKAKSRGFRSFDFDAALADIQRRRVYEGFVDFFVGHNLSVQNVFNSFPYLSDLTMPREVAPFDPHRTSDRRFSFSGEVDLRYGYVDSQLHSKQLRRESALYQTNILTPADVGFEGL